MWDFPLHPPADSLLATRVDHLFYAWLALAGVVTVAVFFLIVYFSVKYRHGSRADRDMPSRRTLRRESHRIEIAWIGAPLILFLGMGFWAAGLYYAHAAPPADATEVYAVGKQWMWKLEHTGGQREIDELHVPAGRPIKLVMTSQDVIHSFFMPVFRIKQDVLPGRYTILWFTADKPGDYHVFCTQYCGTDHARMIGHVVVMQPAAFERWLTSGNASQSMAAEGAARFRQYGCSGCHGASASVHAPKLEGLYGRRVQLSDGSSVVADERYIHDSVMLPRKDVVAGYEPIMPSFQGEIAEDDLLEIVEYIKSLRGAEPGTVR
ncbi:MAG TPA: cytochrome c oxidase subunit II [Casimicrobiaceae bacterium]|nr:cytochrome c oxidase subunit II [Casimicrobiaceae bacterium]